MGLIRTFDSYSDMTTETHHRPERKSSMVRKEYLNKSYSRSERRLTDISDSEVQREPDPDYTPRLRRKVPSTPDVRSSPSADTMKKKVYQKTRFSADIPLVKRKPSNGRPERKSSSLGDTFRKFFGKLGSTNGTNGTVDRKKSRRVESHSNGSISHHSPSRASNYSSYQTFGNVDNHIDDRLLDTTDMGDTSGRDSPLLSHSKLANSSAGSGKYASSFEETATKKRVTTSSAAPLRRLSFTNGTQTLDRNYRSKKRHDDIMFVGNGSSSNGGSGKRSSPAQKYYLGEDPYAGSIYGKEKEYDGAKPFRRKYKNGNSTDDEKKSVKSQIMNGVNHILGRGLSKSTSRLAADSNQRSKKVNIDYTNRGVQTLPRKSKKQVFINDPSSDQENHHSRRLNHHNSNSMINVSMVNNASRTPSFKHTTSELSESPQKPARTYLLRSKSFNVQLGPQHHDRNTFIKSNPQLHKLEKLDESPPPLKSPGIVTSISRSTRDLSKDDDYRPGSSFEHRDFAKTNGYTSASSFDSATSRRPFLRGLKTRTPELYKTLHEDDELDSPTSRLTSTPLRSGRNKLLDYSSSFHSGTTANPASVRKPTVSFESDLRTSPASSFLNKGYSTISRISPDKNGDIVDKSVKRSGSNDDYSETIRMTSKSTDPLRPSVTNTVQSFSKKTVPSKDGRLETIESSETTRVTKSHYRGDGENDKVNSRYKPKNGSVIIEVRNERK